MPPIIIAKNLKKEFLKYERGQGLSAAFKSIIKRKYVKKTAVDNISFKVEKGEILGYIGPNGAGKSTTIKILTGILHPTSGTASVLGYTPWKQRERYVKNIGVVFGQKTQLWWDIPAVDTFYLLRELYNIQKEEFDERLEYMTKLLEVETIKNVPVRNLSLGERMRCEIITAFLHNPKIVFLDEPTIGMDIVAKDKIREFIQKINKKEKTTVILTTHDMSDIEELCKRIIIIDKGKIVYDGSLSKIKNKYTKTRVIKMKLNEPTKKLSLGEGCQATPFTKGYEWEIVVDVKKRSVSGIIASLLKTLDVLDFTILDPKIESVIKNIYEGK